MELLSNRKGVFFPNASLLAALAQQPEAALCSRDHDLMPMVVEGMPLSATNALTHRELLLACNHLVDARFN